MLKIMQKYPAWKVIMPFLKNPTTTYFVWKLTREAEISVFVSSVILRQLTEEGILDRVKKGKFVFYTLKNTPLTRQIKITYAISRLSEINFVEQFLKVDNNITSLAVIGSYAGGEYTEKSSLEILCITEKTEFEFADVVKKLREEFKAEITLRTYSKSLWQDVPIKDKQFYESVLRKNILLYGSEV